MKFLAALVAVLALVAPAAAAQGAPDLLAYQPGYPGYSPYYITTQTFVAGGCAVDEGSITPGTHRLLNFDTYTANIGASDLVVGSPKRNDPANWEYFACHDHWHFLNYAEYTLVDSSGVVVGVGHKQSFCIEDVGVYDPATARDRPRYTCQRQGLSVGYYDAYTSGLIGQWIVIDNVPPGFYTLVQTVDPLHLFGDSDYSNNTISTQVYIP